VNIERSFLYVFDDKDWAPKLLITAAIALASIFTTPLLLIGLVGFVLLLGYQVENIRNVRDGFQNPMPIWENYGAKLRKGGHVMVAQIIYGLPYLIPMCCILTTIGSWDDEYFGSVAFFTILGCVIPLLLLYGLLVWPMLSLGMARYAEEGNIGVFFQFGDLFESTYRKHFTATLIWIGVMILSNLVTGVIGSIPCVGWAAAPAYGLPVQAHLIATYADVCEGRSEGKAKRTL
jgi:hypothetical protein